MTTTCTTCDKEFHSEEALGQHTLAKHPQEEKKPFLSMKTKKSMRNWAILLVLASLLIGAIWFFSLRETEETLPIEGENIIPTSAIHWHPKLTIIIDDVTQLIPIGIGMSASVHYPVHTHESDGTIHLENNSPSRKTMRLGYFFEIWDKEFSNECIFEYCTDNGVLKMTVNGKENTAYENYIMADGDNIVIEYTSFGTTSGKQQ